MSDPTLVFLREQIFWIEEMIENLEQNITSIEEDKSESAVRKTMLLRGLQKDTQSLLEKYTVVANSAAFIN